MEDQKIVAKNFKERTTMTQNNKPVIIQPNSEPCYDFTTNGIERQKRTVIIAPIGIEEYDDNRFKVNYGCSRGDFCKDTECMYVRRFKAEEEPIIGVEPFSSQLDR